MRRLLRSFLCNPELFLRVFDQIMRPTQRAAHRVALDAERCGFGFAQQAILLWDALEGG